MWALYHMACVSSGKCSCLLGASWLEGCGHEVLRVVSLGELSISKLHYLFHNLAYPKSFRCLVYLLSS